RVARHGVHESLDETLVALDASVVDRVIGEEQMERYQDGLERLTDEQRQAVLLRLEFDYSYEQIAEALGKPSPDAARMMVGRAIAALAEIMDSHGR
ncbi:MAG TPA: sigma-70 family RNA polymerase sigma factor, partial [Candidatus Krumholzibacteria bacterium]|nr:sigma-70 family RNA polymerase sigma factor [Candidatus Krumholzibacteria bacterium]